MTDFNNSMTQELVRRLIDDLEWDQSLGATSTPITPLLSELRRLRDYLPLQRGSAVTDTGLAA